jgi:putative redox protein
VVVIAMTEVTVRYLGDLHCEAQHGPSGATFVTDAPVDNQGKGEAFSPTDLVGTALGTCILTIMGILARRDGWDLSGATATVTKEMVTAPVRRIGKLTVRIHVPRDLPEEARRKLEAGAHTCPVHKSLHPDIEAPLLFTYGAAAAT